MLILAATASVLPAMNLSIMNVVYRDVQEAFPHVSSAQLSWVLNAYTVVSAATSQLVPGNILKTPSFRMGSVAITNMRIVFGEFEVFQMWEVNDEPAIVLGMDVLGTTAAMMLDFTRKELCILPNIAGDMVPMRKRGPATRIPRD